MDLVELWVLLKTLYEEHHYNGRWLIQPQYQFPHVTSNINETEITTGTRSAFSGRKSAKNQTEALSIEYCTNLANALEEAGKGPTAMHVRNMQKIEENRNLARQVKYTKGKFRNPDNTLVTQQQTNCSTLEITDKIPLEKVIIEETWKSTTRPKDLAHYLMKLGCTEILEPS